MPGCKDNCMFYYESYGKDAIPLVDQDDVLKQIENLEKGEEFDPATLFKIVKIRCLIDELKDEESSKIECKQYSENLGKLEAGEIMKIALEHRKGIKDNKWKIATFVISVLAILSSALFAYIGLSKPSEEALKNQIEIQSKQLEQKDSLIISQNKTIEELRGEQKDDQK